MARLLLVVAAALILCGVASAATIDDLRAAGYTVSLDGGPTNCPTYYVTGHGTSIYVNCNSQDVIDGLANPVAVCNADWQTNHPDQVDAWLRISQKGWGVSGDQCADIYTVSNPNDGTTAYSGSGAGLPPFNQTHDAPPMANGSPPPPGAQATPPKNCLPLCPTTPLVIDPVTALASPVTASSVIAPTADPIVAAAIAAILFTDRSEGYLVRAGYGYDGALTP